jgi:CubicO group peptidase (beta-lactamase class C family)
MFDKRFLVGAFSHFDVLYPSHKIAAATQPWQFIRPATPPEIVYAHAGDRYAIADYLTHLPITGLLIAKGDEILFEAYQYGRTDRDLLTSQSMAKTIVGMLVGVAISEHSIAAITDTAAQYVPELANSDYGKVTIRDLLTMTSGVTCQESESEAGTAGAQTLAHGCKQTSPAGTVFKYSGTDAQVLSLILKRAVHMPVADYLDEKIWKRIGTEAAASWNVDGTGQELGACCFNAVLRDYARFARLLAFDGAWNGQQLIPRQWIAEATAQRGLESPLAARKASRFFGYGYQVWTFPGERRMLCLLGANGQRIFVDPQSKLIMVQTAVTPKAIDERDSEMLGLWFGLVRRFGS